MSEIRELTPIRRRADGIIDAVCQRIHHKMRDYAAYRFTAPQSCALNVFFDLVQEYDETEKLYVLAVLILRMFFNYDAELYLRDASGGCKLMTPAVHPELVGIPELRPEIWQEGSRCYIPIRDKDSLVITKARRIVAGQNLMGVLVVYAGEALKEHDLLFLEKFANRVGFCLHNKNLSNNNARHILFLQQLAHDIGHNIVTPNMRLRLMLNHMERHILELGELADKGGEPESAWREIRKLQQGMLDCVRDIGGTFTNSALFLESLLRQSHFDMGHYVLRLARIDLNAKVVIPQFDRYRPHLKEKALLVDDDQPLLPDEPCMVEADMGLISQVLANLLSNAVKYASAKHEAKPGRVACSVTIEPDAFGEGKDGIKVGLFSSGPHLTSEEAERIFDDNYRAANAVGKSGTGHGLFFVHAIVKEHGGVSGYQAVRDGNVFYFMLPRA